MTAEDFAALVADLRKELAEADGETRRRMLAVPRPDPAAYKGRPWVWTPVGAIGASTVTGYKAASLRGYKARAAQARAEGTDTQRTMPAPDADGNWVIGDLAMWMATRDEDRAAAIKVSDEIADAIRAGVDAVRREGTRRAVPDGVYAALAQQFGVSTALVRYIASGRLPASGRTGPYGARDRRREISLIPETRKAAQVIAERDGRVTFTGLADELGIDYRTAVGRAAMAGIKSDLEHEHAGDAEVSAFLKARLAETARHLKEPVLVKLLHEAGIPAQKTQVHRLLPDLRAAVRMQAQRPVGTERARGESLHPRGWLYATQVAQDWGVTVASITAAIGNGDIRVAERSHGRTWIDPARLRARTDRIRTPVDKDHPKARPEPGEPGDPGYEERS